MFEAQLRRQHASLHRRRRYQQPDQFLSQHANPDPLLAFRRRFAAQRLHSDDVFNMVKIHFHVPETVGPYSVFRAPENSKTKLPRFS